jgi:hypothetical protein
MNFNYLRLGQLRYEIPKYEYIFRDCHVASIDIASVKQSDAPGRSMQSPNGFFSDELCQIARYCGLSTRLQSIGFYEFNPNFDLRNQTAQLYAQAIWYFIEGFSLRYDFSPNSEAMKDQCKNYIVAPEGFEEQPFHFWKYEDLNQWWFEATVCGVDGEIVREAVTVPFFHTLLSALFNGTHRVDTRHKENTEKNQAEVYHKADKFTDYDTTERYPRSVLLFPSDKQKIALHPTQKPVALFEYLIKTYTNEGETVLDNCAGSFTTAIAADNLKRKWICIEKEAEYCEIGRQRIEENRKRLLTIFDNCDIL